MVMLRSFLTGKSVLAIAILLLLGGFLFVLGTPSMDGVANAGDEGSDESEGQVFLPYCDEIELPDPHEPTLMPQELPNLGLDGSESNVVCGARPTATETAKPQSFP